MRAVFYYITVIFGFDRFQAMVFSTLNCGGVHSFLQGQCPVLKINKLNAWLQLFSPLFVKLTAAPLEELSLDGLSFLLDLSLVVKDNEFFWSKFRLTERAH